MAGSTPERRPSSLAGLAKVAGRLVPRQLNDEIQLAIAQMKAKGIQVGIAAAIAAVALVFVALLVVALLVAGILGLGLVVDPWLAALLVAALLLVLAAILGLIGYSRVKKALPLVPEDAMRGIKHDLGILKEGSSFDPSTLDEEKPKDEKPKKDKEDKDKNPPVPYAELLHRSKQRREHLTRVRDRLGPKLDMKARASGGVHRASAFAEAKKGQAAASLSQKAPAGDDTARLLREKWQPLAVMAASLVALVAFVRQLVRR